MAWIKVDDGFFNNQKIVSVSKDAKIIYLAALCHAGATLSDGFIPKNAVVILAAQCDVRSHVKATKELIGAGLWHEEAGGFRIHDYLEHNTSSQEVHAQREAAKERARRKRSPEVRANNHQSSPEVRQKFASQKEEVETETKLTTPSGVVEGASAPKPKAKRNTQVPEDFVVTDALEAWGASQDPPFSPEAMRVEVPQFVDYYRGKGEKRADWNRSFHTWMRNSRKFDNANSRAAPAKSTGKITSVDELFAQGVDDETAGYTENSRDSATKLAAEWPGQNDDTSLDVSAGRHGFRVIASGGG